jgi:hypothetical protein
LLKAVKWFLLLVSVGAFAIYFFSNETIRPKKFTSFHEPNEAAVKLLLIGDSRSQHLKKFAYTFETSLSEFGLEASVHIFHQNKAAFATPCCPATFDLISHGFHEDTYFIYGEGSHLLKEGKTFTPTGKVVQELMQEHFPFHLPENPLQPGLPVADSVINDAFPWAGDGPHVVLLQEDVCFSCPTGQRVAWLEEQREIFPNVTFAGVLVTELTAEEVFQFAEGEELVIPLVKAGPSLDGYWRDVRARLGRFANPLDGQFVGVSKGVIQFLGTTPEEVAVWLPELYESSSLEPPSLN